MGERNATHTDSSENPEDFLDPLLGEFGEDDFDDLETAVAACKESLAEKRRKAERRLEALRLREELGDFDFEFDDEF